MAQIIYNLNSIRAPLSGIGRYAAELLRAGQRANLPVLAAKNGNLYGGEKLVNLLSQLDKPTPQDAANWRALIGKIPFSRELYRHIDCLHFTRVAKKQFDNGAIYHDINFSHCQPTANRVTTIYDLSHQHYPETHPRHRVRFLYRYFRRLAKSTSPIITISHSVKQELVEHQGLNSERIHVTPLAADSCFRPRSADQCSKTLNQYNLRYKRFVLSVGTLEPRKNIPMILEAYSRLDRSLQNHFPLVIVGGRGWKSSRVTAQINRLEQQGVLRNLRFVPQSQLPHLYSAANTFIYPSLYEGFGLPLLEAMQSGCPSITSNGGALAELAAQHAITLDPHDSDAIHANLNKLLQDASLNALYTKLGPERAKNFNWSKTATQTHEIYNAI